MATDVKSLFRLVAWGIHLLDNTFPSKFIPSVLSTVCTKKDNMREPFLVMRIFDKGTLKKWRHYSNV